ncbi:MAG: kelch repeat-containing protein [bacterium]|nr:kelch repeat-containing protein [bacterium]
MVYKITVFVATFCAFYGFSQEWVQTGSLNHSRCDHAAILLQNGKVLVTGGIGAYNSCELYDPGSGIWKETGNLNQERWSHAAVLLQDGRVLVVAGYAWDGVYGQFLSDYEIYDPETGSFEDVPPLIPARENHTATLLQDGRVLVAGGWIYPPGFLNDCQLFITEPKVEEKVSKVCNDFSVTPNPFTHATFVSFSVTHMDWVELSVYDIAGRMVKTLVNSLLEPGIYKIEWNGDDESGAEMPTGFYIVRLNMKGSIRSKGLIFVNC